jgi:ketosteroid isomerase-like protein
MRRAILVCTVALVFIGGNAFGQEPGAGTRSPNIWGRSPGPPPVGPLANLVQAGVDAYNKGDMTYFEKMFADDILWIDEDGHELTSKTFCLYFIGKQITATPKRTMKVNGVATGTWGDTAWAAFAYTVNDGVNERKGMNTTLFRKIGNDWKIVLIHGAINAFALPH